MKVSFLVTYYNQEKYVRQSMDSILAIEKPFDWEILVGDDGSTDSTVEIVKEYMVQYPGQVFLYVMDREPGKKYEIVRRSSANRLNLVKHMTGNYFCFLDGDDCFNDREFVAQALEIYSRNKGISVVAFGYQRFSEENGVLDANVLPAGAVDTGAYLRGRYVHAGACLLKNCFTQERLNWLQEIGYYDDNNILINNLHYGSMYAVDRPIYGYRQTDNSTFNAMNMAEQAVLNVQGWDVDRLLLPEHAQDLAVRYGVCLKQMYFLRHRLKTLLGAEKHERYLQGCRTIPNSMAYALLAGTALSADDRKLLCKVLLVHPKQTLQVLLACGKLH